MINKTLNVRGQATGPHLVTYKELIMLMGMQIITVIVLIMALIIIMFGLLKYLIDSEKAYRPICQRLGKYEVRMVSSGSTNLRSI